MTTQQKNITVFAKLATLLLFTIALLLQTNIWIAGGLCATTIVFSLFYGRDGTLIIRLKALSILAVMLMLFNLLPLLDEPLNDRALRGGLAAAKLVGISLSVFLFVTTTSLATILRAFSFLPTSWQLMLTIALSLLPAVMQELRTIIAAQKSRGFSPSLLRLIPTITATALPLLFRTLLRAEHIAMVIVARGFDNSSTLRATAHPETSSEDSPK
jgi:energy-coupling factor transporter transmembrane protein EcfT